ncbi:MAG: hypothetical protein JWM86_1421 [Thermoleophilia bacterium]|nr:hypothetical protein [Thermoleophilia bacterium]
MNLSSLAAFPTPNPAGGRVAAVIAGGAHGTTAQLADTLTGYGRKEGYDSFANARRAAYMLTRGAERQAAGVYQVGSRFYVRAMGEVTHHAGALLALHFEGAAEGAKLLKVTDPRLLVLVDGSTKAFAPTA